ncbi:MAG TPA: HEAT repeat domain-containing protein [Planctomycetota bacterium]|nr:HEAT repeat domain-containing protein [Planctomycetota bacterium]
MTRLLALLPLLLAGCASSPDPKREPAPEETERHRALQKAEERRRDINTVLLRLDQSIDSYVQALSNQGEIRADQQAERLERSIRDMVLDQGLERTRIAGGTAESEALPPGENFRRLQALAADGSEPRQQAIALAALGFSEKLEMMPIILQGAQLSDPLVVDHAVLGLAVLRSPATPPGVLAAIVEKQGHPDDGRVQAAWALYRLQPMSNHPAEIQAIWRRLLTERRDSVPTGVLVSAVRGLGLARDPANAALVASFVKHPTARVRMAVCVALGRMNAQDYADALIELLGPQETVQNVRLHASKALVTLAGGKDYQYDVGAWRKVFERGRQESASRH